MKVSTICMSRISHHEHHKMKRLYKQYKRVNKVLNKRLERAKRQNCFLPPLTKDCRFLILEIDELTELSQKIEEQLNIMELYDDYKYDQELEERLYDV